VCRMKRWEKHATSERPIRKLKSKASRGDGSGREGGRRGEEERRRGGEEERRRGGEEERRRGGGEGGRGGGRGRADAGTRRGGSIPFVKESIFACMSSVFSVVSSNNVLLLSLLNNWSSSAAISLIA
jgi:hypothetical protein